MEEGNIHISIYFIRDFYYAGKEMPRSLRAINFDIQGKHDLSLFERLNGTSTGDVQRLEIKPITLEEYEKMQAKNDSPQD